MTELGMKEVVATKDMLFQIINRCSEMTKAEKQMQRVMVSEFKFELICLEKYLEDKTSGYEMAIIKACTKSVSYDLIGTMTTDIFSKFIKESILTMVHSLESEE